MYIYIYISTWFIIIYDHIYIFISYKFDIMKQSDDILISLTHMIKHLLEKNYIFCGQFVKAFANRDKLLGQVDVWAMGVIMYGLVSGCGLRAVTTTIHGGPVTAWAVLEFFFGLPKGVRLVVARCTFSLRCLWLSHFCLLSCQPSFMPCSYGEFHRFHCRNGE